MKAPADHLRYLRKKFVPKSDFSRTGYSFTQEECNLLARYGHWLMALQNRWISPITPLQEHFIACCLGNAETSTPLERLWFKYINSVDAEISANKAHHDHIDNLEAALRWVGHQIRDVEDQEYWADNISALEAELQEYRGY